MKIALLIPFRNIITMVDGWQWQSPSEQELSIEFNTKEEALRNKPVGYKHLDDGWGLII